jgi:hypothetical protein
MLLGKKTKVRKKDLLMALQAAVAKLDKVVEIFGKLLDSASPEDYDEIDKSFESIDNVFKILERFGLFRVEKVVVRRVKATNIRINGELYIDRELLVLSDSPYSLEEYYERLKVLMRDDKEMVVLVRVWGGSKSIPETIQLVERVYE